VTLASGTIGRIFGADPARGLASSPLFEKSLWDSERPFKLACALTQRFGEFNDFL